MSPAQGQPPSARLRFLILLGAPALAMAFAVTVVSTYLPVLLGDITGPIAIGLLIGAEGFLGIFVPGAVGAMSDRRSTRVGDRVRPLVASAVLVAAAMAAVSTLAIGDWDAVAGYALALVVLYFGYHAFLAPYWALYPDLVPDAQSGRSQSAAGTWRVVGTGLALIAGGALLGLGDALPFLAAVAVVGLCVAGMLIGIRGSLDRPVDSGSERGAVDRIRSLLQDRRILRLCIANALWNFALAGLRAFVVLYFVSGLDRSAEFVSSVVFPLVAVGLAVGAPSAGKLADRFGHVPVVLIGLAVYAIGMALPLLSQSAWVLALIPVVAAGAGVVQTLPMSFLMRLVPADNHASATGLMGFSLGVGGTLGPLVTGIAIEMSSGLFSGTGGYAALWAVCSIALAASGPLVWSLRGDRRLAPQ